MRLRVGSPSADQSVSSTVAVTASRPGARRRPPGGAGKASQPRTWSVVGRLQHGGLPAALAEPALAEPQQGSRSGRDDVERDHRSAGPKWSRP